MEYYNWKYSASHGLKDSINTFFNNLRLKGELVSADSDPARFYEIIVPNNTVITQSYFGKKCQWDNISLKLSKQLVIICPN